MHGQQSFKTTMCIQELGCACMDWIELDQDRDSSLALVNVVMNTLFPYNAEISLLIENWFVSPERLCPME